MCERHVQQQGYQCLSFHLRPRLTAVWKLIGQLSAELERRKMNMLLFLDPLAGGQKRSMSIYRAEESGRTCQSGLCWDCPSWRCPEQRPLTPPLVHSVSYASVTALKRFSSGVCHRVWHWWLVGGRLGRRCVNYWADGEFLQGKCHGFISHFTLPYKPWLYVCSCCSGPNTLSFISRAGPHHNQICNWIVYCSEC